MCAAFEELTVPLPVQPVGYEALNSHKLHFAILPWFKCFMGECEVERDGAEK